MTADRVRLPATREGQTHKVGLGKLELYLTVNTDDEGDVREVFGKCAEHQGELDGLCEMTSVALQYGAPANIVIKHLRFRNYPPHGGPGQPCSISDAVGIELEAVQKGKK